MPRHELNRYKLNVRVEIVREPQRPGDGYWSPSQERLNVDEILDLGSLDFLGVMNLLGQLHDAITRMKNSPSVPPQCDGTGTCPAHPTGADLEAALFVTVDANCVHCGLPVPCECAMRWPERFFK